MDGLVYASRLRYKDPVGILELVVKYRSRGEIWPDRRRQRRQ